MATLITLRLYGAHQARNDAYALLENLPQIKKINKQDDAKTISLCLNKQLTEKTLIPLLHKSGISGFSIE